MARFVAVLAAAALLAGCGGGDHVSQRSVRIGGVDGYLVTPGTDGRHPGVVIVHGSGGDRGELLGQATALAKEGVVALTITEPSSAHPQPRASTLEGLLVQAQRTQERDTAAVRSAARFLASRADVDHNRLGYLGWSAGAKTGTFVVDRFRAVALLSAGAATVDQFAAAAPPPVRADVRRALTPIDPIRAVGRARPGSLLLEDGRQDEIVPHAALLNVVRAAPRGTVVRWYDAGHALSPRAYADARAWLLRKLRT
jgi:dienelactone hydrolase